MFFKSVPAVLFLFFSFSLFAFLDISKLSTVLLLYFFSSSHFEVTAVAHGTNGADPTVPLSIDDTVHRAKNILFYIFDAKI